MTGGDGSGEDGGVVCGDSFGEPKGVGGGEGLGENGGVLSSSSVLCNNPPWKEAEPGSGLVKNGSILGSILIGAVVAVW